MKSNNHKCNLIKLILLGHLQCIGAKDNLLMISKSWCVLVKPECMSECLQQRLGNAGDNAEYENEMQKKECWEL